MNLKDRAILITEALQKQYSDAECTLDAVLPHELLISARLSAQCTDARVNTVTKTLFSRYRSVDEFAAADINELENIVRSCGFFKIKSRDIIAMCKMLSEKHGGIVPDTMEQLLELPGVGRKTANLILGDLYGKPAIVTDTHCIRIANRLGLCDSLDPVKVEKALLKLIPTAESSMFCHRLVLHGRAVCAARKARCEICRLNELCVKKIEIHKK